MYLILGREDMSGLEMSDADATFIGEDGGDYAGRSVSSAGDVDGDGLGDLVMGAWGDDDGGTEAGAELPAGLAPLAARP